MRVKISTHRLIIFIFKHVYDFVPILDADNFLGKFAAFLFPDQLPDLGTNTTMACIHTDRHRHRDTSAVPSSGRPRISRRSSYVRYRRRCRRRPLLFSMRKPSMPPARLTIGRYSPVNWDSVPIATGYVFFLGKRFPAADPGIQHFQIFKCNVFGIPIVNGLGFPPNARIR